MSQQSTGESDLLSPPRTSRGVCTRKKVTATPQHQVQDPDQNKEESTKMNVKVSTSMAQCRACSSEANLRSDFRNRCNDHEHCMTKAA